MITVVAALIQQDGRLLICQRRRTDPFPLKWEFPGGKVRVGEQPAEALTRELAEELGIAATVGRELYRTRHRYADQPEELEILFFTARIGHQQPRNLAFESIAWVEPASLGEYDFLAADRAVISLLARGALRAG